MKNKRKDIPKRFFGERMEDLDGLDVTEHNAETSSDEVIERLYVMPEQLAQVG